MYFDSLETRSFEELYQIRADDFLYMLVQDTCPDVRLKNVLLRGGILTARDLLMSSPKKVFGLYGFGRLTAIQLNKYLDQVLDRENQMVQAVSSKEPDLPVVKVELPQKKDAPRQPAAGKGPQTQRAKGPGMEDLLRYIGWMTPDNIDTVKKVMLLLAMISASDEKGFAFQEEVREAYLKNCRVILSGSEKQAMDITELPAYKALFGKGYIYSVIRLGQRRCIKFQRPLCDELLSDEYQQLFAELEEKLKNIDRSLRESAAPKTKPKSRSPLEKLAARLNSEIFRATYLGDIRISGEEYLLLKEYLRSVIRGEKTELGKLNRPMFAVAVVQVGTRAYRNGNFWSNFYREIELDEYIKKPAARERVGELFVTTLSLYRKASCSENEFVSNILLHTYVSNYYASNYFDFLYRFYSYDLDRDIGRLDRQMVNDLVDAICAEEKRDRTYLLVEHTADAIRANRAGGKIRVRNHLKKIDHLFWNEERLTTSNRLYELMQNWVDSSSQFTKEAGLSRITYERGMKRFSTPYLQRNPATGVCVLQFPSQSIRRCENMDVKWVVSGAAQIEVPVELTESVLGYRVLPTSVDVPQDTVLQAYRCDIVDGDGTKLRSFPIPAERVRIFDQASGYPVNSRNLKVGDAVALSKPQDKIYSSALYYSEPSHGLLVSFFHFEYEDIVRLPDNRAVIIGRKLLENGLVGGGLVEGTVCTVDLQESALYSRPPYLVLRMQETKSAGTGIIVNGSKRKLLDCGTVSFSVDDMSGETGYYIDLKTFGVQENGWYDIIADIPGGALRSWSFVLCNGYSHSFENAPYIFEPKGTIVFPDGTPLLHAEGGYHKEKDSNTFEFDVDQPDRCLRFALGLGTETGHLSIPIPALYIKRGDGKWQSSKPLPVWHGDLPDVIELSVPYHKVELELDFAQDMSDNGEGVGPGTLEFRRNRGDTSILCEIRKLKSYLTGEPALRNIRFRFGSISDVLLQVLTQSVVTSCSLYGDYKKNSIHVSADILGKAEYYVDIFYGTHVIGEKIPFVNGEAVLRMGMAIRMGEYRAVIYEKVQDDSGFDEDEYRQISEITQEMVNPYDMNGKCLRIVAIHSKEDATAVYPVSFDYRLEDLSLKEGIGTYSGKMIVLDRSKNGRAVAAYEATAVFPDLERPNTVELYFPDEEYEEEEIFLYDTRRHAILKNANPSIKQTERYRRYIVLDSESFDFSIEFCRPCGVNTYGVPSQLVLPELNYFHGMHWAPSRRLGDLLPDVDFKGYTSIDQLALLTKTQCASRLGATPDVIDQISMVLHGFGLAFKAEPYRSRTGHYSAGGAIYTAAGAASPAGAPPPDKGRDAPAPAADAPSKPAAPAVESGGPAAADGTDAPPPESVKGMGLRPYVYNCLINGGIRTVPSLQQLVDTKGRKGLLQIKNCTSAIADEVMDALRRYNMNRRDD